MKPGLSVLLIFILSLSARSQGPAYTLDLVTWNVEWLGDPGAGPADDNLQERNVRKILRDLNADLYGLVEVVDTARLARLTDSLGSDFAYVVAPFASGNTTGTGASWRAAQKLAYIYRKSMFSNVRTRGLMRTSNDAYWNFASGRFPYLLTADVQLGGVTQTMNFILIHAKAGSTEADYTRRIDGAQELKDTLNAQFSNSIVVLMGDFNDALNRTICSACPTILSSYDPIIKDSVDADHYRSLTLPLAYADQSSMVTFPNVIDNFVVSNEAMPFYIANSTLIRTDLAATVSNYGNTTSDHYPVISSYYFGGLTALPSVQGKYLVGKSFSKSQFRFLEHKIPAGSQKHQAGSLPCFGQPGTFKATCLYQSRNDGEHSQPQCSRNIFPPYNYGFRNTSDHTGKTIKKSPTESDLFLLSHRWRSTHEDGLCFQCFCC